VRSAGAHRPRDVRDRRREAPQQCLDAPERDAGRLRAPSRPDGAGGRADAGPAPHGGWAGRGTDAQRPGHGAARAPGARCGRAPDVARTASRGPPGRQGGDSEEQSHGQRECEDGDEQRRHAGVHRCGDGRRHAPDHRRRAGARGGARSRSTSCPWSPRRRPCAPRTR
jgi:hypothetical protein